jgi:hypothetical protein
LNPRKLIGLIALAVLILTSLASEFVIGANPDDWPLSIKAIFGLAICIAIFAAFYDRRNFAEKHWDFNPKRGALYFGTAWFIYPVVIGVGMLLEASLSWTGILVGTAIVAVLAGALGTFTENTGL